MSCKICGRGSCTTSFHPLSEQLAFDKYESMDTRELIGECIDKDNEIADLKNIIKELEKDIEEYVDA